MSDSGLNTAKLAAKYSYATDAEALFFRPHNGEKPAFRFELPEVGYEFSDGLGIGSEIKGIFYYKKGEFGDKLPSDRPTKADFYVHSNKHGSHNKYVHIEFFEPGSQDELLGEFRGIDLDDILSDCELVNKRHEGTWKRVDYIIATASLTSPPLSRRITLTAEALGKQVEFYCKSGDTLHRTGFHTHGRLTLTNLTAFSNSSSVGWYHDHIVFYEDDNSKKFTAFYYPDLTHIADDKVIFEDIAWNKI